MLVEKQAIRRSKELWWNLHTILFVSSSRTIWTWLKSGTINFQKELLLEYSFKSNSTKLIFLLVLNIWKRIIVYWINSNSRHTFSLPSQEVVQLFSQTTIQSQLQGWLSIRWTITSHLGPSASCQIVKMLYSTLPK